MSKALVIHLEQGSLPVQVSRVLSHTFKESVKLSDDSNRAINSIRASVLGHLVHFVNAFIRQYI